MKEMDTERVFQVLKKQKKSVLIELLEAAYYEMDRRQQRYVFGEIVAPPPPASIGGQELLHEVKEFERESKAGVYYAPFDINSKNFMHIPEETEEWFDRMGDLLKDSSRLTAQGDHAEAVECFAVLFKLIETMGDGDEIVFADELGSWLIPGGEKEPLAAYLASLAATKSPEEFTSAALPFIRDDSIFSFVNKAYSSANRVASKEQKAHLRAEIKRQNIATGPSSRRK